MSLRTPQPPQTRETVRFGRFRLDLRAGVVWRDDTPIALRPKTFAVLEFLVRHPGELVSKEALLDAIWSDVAVTDDMPRLSIGELRRALGDDRRAPTLIVTVPRRGYRFVAPVEPAAPGAGGCAPAVTGAPPDWAAPIFVGREGEHRVLEAALQTVLTGSAQVAVVMGEMGIGKTALIEAFLRRRSAPASAGGRPGLRVAWGEALEQYGRREPYLAVLEALRRLTRRPDAEALRATLRRRAPSWLLRAVGLDLDDAAPAVVTIPPGQSLRVLADTVAALSLVEPLILVLEDLQCSGPPTVDLLNLLAHRREPARLLLLGTLRESDAMLRRHPVLDVVRDLHRRGLCGVLHPAELSEPEIAEYLAQRLSGQALASLPRLLLDRSGGNPLFLTALVDDLVSRALLHPREGGQAAGVSHAALAEHVPAALVETVALQLERTSPAEHRVLEAASVTGMEFSIGSIATTLGDDVEAVEERCDALSTCHGLLRRLEPVDRADVRYAFRLALHRQVVRQRIPASRRWRLERAAAAQEAPRSRRGS